jgi:hypothetical protein
MLPNNNDTLKHMNPMIFLAIFAIGLAGLIFALCHLSGAKPSWRITLPSRPYGDCITPDQAVDFANRDTNRILGNVSLVIARRSPYNDVLDGGVLPSGISDVTRSIVQERAVLGHSLVNPEFVDDLTVCGTDGEQAQVGSTEFSETLQTIRGRGPRVCVKTTRAAFQGSYPAAEDAIKKQLVQLTNSDVRAQLVARGGSKLTVVSSAAFETMYQGDVNAINTPFNQNLNGGLPDSAINFSLLKRLVNFMREDLLAEGFESNDQVNPIFKAIVSQDQLDLFRQELNIQDDMRALVTGKYPLGERTITRYSWEGPYRGVAFGIDPQPLRFSDVDSDGQPIFIEPEISVATSKGVGARINPPWARARFEVMMLMGANTFRRRVPEQYMGSGGFKFPPQLVQGELEFAVIRDNDCNLFGDFGQHLYQVSRSYRPERPHGVCAIAYKRCNQDFGLVSCPDYQDYSGTDSL